MTARQIIILALIWLSIGASVLDASTIIVSSFTQITNAGFFDAASGANTINPVTIGSVVVTPNPNPTFLNTSFGNFNAPQLGPSVPGNGNGFGSCPCGVGGAIPLLLNFSQPVAAFGVTFQHIDNPTDHSSTLPVMIEVFSGIDGGGTLLGTVIDPGGGSLNAPFADFRGLWSTNLDIRSARISATSPPNGGYLVDGFGISLTTQTPEPTTVGMAALGLIGFAILQERTRRRLRLGRPL